ncbi:hypothetical protein C8R47DRAFT_1204746 [Mycena vitilis]|nr:hypothetical protein C8R47DRAFT_1204746 [Mycena vitilis]
MPWREQRAHEATGGTGRRRGTGERRDAKVQMSRDRLGGQHGGNGGREAASIVPWNEEGTGEPRVEIDERRVREQLEGRVTAGARGENGGAVRSEERARLPLNGGKRYVRKRGVLRGSGGGGSMGENGGAVRSEERAWKAVKNGEVCARHLARGMSSSAWCQGSWKAAGAADARGRVRRRRAQRGARVESGKGRGRLRTASCNRNWKAAGAAGARGGSGGAVRGEEDANDPVNGGGRDGSERERAAEQARKGGILVTPYYVAAGGVGPEKMGRRGGSQWMDATTSTTASKSQRSSAASEAGGSLCSWDLSTEEAINIGAMGYEDAIIEEEDEEETTTVWGSDISSANCGKVAVHIHQADDFTVAVVLRVVLVYPHWEHSDQMLSALFMTAGSYPSRHSMKGAHDEAQGADRREKAPWAVHAQIAGKALPRATLPPPFPRRRPEHGQPQERSCEHTKSMGAALAPRGLRWGESAAAVCAAQHSPSFAQRLPTWRAIGNGQRPIPLAPTLVASSRYTARSPPPSMTASHPGQLGPGTLLRVISHSRPSATWERPRHGRGGERQATAGKWHDTGLAGSDQIYTVRHRTPCGIGRQVPAFLISTQNSENHISRRLRAAWDKGVVTERFILAVRQQSRLYRLSRDAMPEFAVEHDSAGKKL